jgi:small-conductance mechanosensitive channel
MSPVSPAAAAAWLAALPDWQAVLVLVLGAVVLSAVVQIGGDRLLGRLTARIPGDVDDVVFGYVHLGIWVTILVGGVSLGFDRIGFLDGFAAPVRAGALSIIALTWGYAFLRIGPPVLTAVTDSRYVDDQVRPIFQNVWTVAVLAVSLFAVLAIWRIDVTPLLASAGVLGIIVGLAARDTIANFFGSIALYADGTYTSATTSSSRTAPGAASRTSRSGAPSSGRATTSS